jgi:tetratricopeptide (TPR) repeat protein
MDLPTCPACGQSVLDDDPQVCPFCGASMSGKPGGTPPPQAPADPKPASRKKKEVDPFAIDTSTSKPVARVALRAAPGRPHEVKCPMCETVGYVPTAAAGKLVKCANASCLVPVFEAPPIEVAEPEPEPTKKTSPLMVVLLLLVIGGGGFGIYKTMFSEPGVNPLPPPPDPGDFAGVGGTQRPGAGDTRTAPKDGEAAPPEAPTIDLASFRQELIERTMLDIATSRERNGKRNRSREFCRQQIAEAYARIGQLDNAIAQLEHIDKSNPDLFFKERLPPLIEIGWQQLGSGDRSALEVTLQQAEQAAAQSPPAGRPRFDRLASFAALLVAADQPEKAKRWLTFAIDIPNVTDAEELERIRQASSQLVPFKELPDYQLTLGIDNPLHRRQSPEAVTVALLLAGRGYDQQAVRWIKSLAERERSDAFLAYMQWNASRDENGAAAAEPLVSDQPSVIQVRILSAVSRRVREAGNAELADNILAQAIARAEDLPGGEELILPAPQSIPGFQLPDSQALLHAALALEQLAQAHSAAGQTDDAWNAYRRALMLCRATAPSPTALASRPRRDGDPGAEQVKQLLARELDLANDEQIRIQFNQFTTRLNQFDAPAQRRMLWVTALLDQAADGGFEEQAWEEVRVRNDETDPDRKESMIPSPLVSKLRDKLKAGNKTKALEQIASRLGARSGDSDPPATFVSALEGMLAEGNFDRMAESARQARIDRYRLELVLLDRIRQQLGQGRAARCLSLIESLPDTLVRPSASGTMINDQLLLVREDLYYFLGRNLAASGRGPDAITLFQNLLPTPTEEISFLAGIVVGLDVPSAAPRAAPAEEKSEASAGGE